MVSYADIIDLCHSVAILCDAALMSCEVTALLFQAHANYGTWSIDFGTWFVYESLKPNARMGVSLNGCIFFIVKKMELI